MFIDNAHSKVTPQDNMFAVMSRSTGSLGGEVWRGVAVTSPAAALEGEMVRRRGSCCGRSSDAVRTEFRSKVLALGKGGPGCRKDTLSKELKGNCTWTNHGIFLRDTGCFQNDLGRGEPSPKPDTFRECVLSFKDVGE